MIDSMVDTVAERIETEIPILVLDDYNEELLGCGPKFIPALPKDIYHQISGNEIDDDSIRLILIMKDFFYDWTTVDEDDIEVIIRHEYGHHLTWGDITQDDMKEERFKLMLFELILHSFENSMLLSPKYEAEYMWFHHRMKSERIASEAAGLNRHDVRRVLFHQSGYRVHNSIPYIDVIRLIEKPLDFDTAVLTVDGIFDAVMGFIPDIMANDLLDDMLYRKKFEDMLKMWISFTYES